MLNFTVGPVQSDEDILSLGSEQVPYFRTKEFSNLMLDNENCMLRLVNASENSKAMFLTGSGTAAMEASVVNTLSEKDKVLVVDGGSFGHRFVELLSLHNIEYTEIKLNVGEALSEEHIKKFDNEGYTAFLVNIHETSTGVHYDCELIAQFCKRNKLFLLVDAISSFLADPFDMKEMGADVVITSSQKALACPPGISIIVLSPKAIERVNSHDTKCMYLDLKSALTNQQRGQTPFTPAVSILIQLNKRFNNIIQSGGAQVAVESVSKLAQYFRNKIVEMGLPFEFVAESPSNAVTTLHPINVSAETIFLTLKDKYGIWICPNGGILKDRMFRVGHIGCLKKEDYDVLLGAFEDMRSKGEI